MRNYILSLIVVLALASVSMAAPLIYTIGFDAVDLSFDSTTGQLEFLANQRVSTVTYDDGTQVPFTNLEILLTTTLLADNSGTAPDPSRAKAVFAGGNLSVTAAGGLLGDMLKVNLDKLYIESTTTMPTKQLLVASADFATDSIAWPDPSNPGGFSQPMGPTGNIFVLGWYLPTSVTDFGSDFAVTAKDADLSLQITFVPEPATMGLLAIGGVALLKRRRK